jgi:hypothetical protein
MAVADEDVQASYWEHAATPTAVPILRRAVRCFAEERGMNPLALDALDLALCEVVAHGVWSAAEHRCDEPIGVDAAADPGWMSVWVTYCHSDVDHTVLPLASLLADRVETGGLVDGERSRVVLEFALVPDALIADADAAGDRRSSDHG